MFEPKDLVRIDYKWDSAIHEQVGVVLKVYDLDEASAPHGTTVANVFVPVANTIETMNLDFLEAVEP